MTDFNDIYEKYASKWESFGILSEKKFVDVKEVGVYRLLLEDEIMYVGRGIELNNKGLFKRLNDYVRKSDSGRKSLSGRRIHSKRDSLNVELIAVGNDQEAVCLASLLERMFIYELKPKWNKD